MKVERAPTDAQSAEALREHLASCDFVSRFDSPDHRESEALAHALWDIEDSCRTLLQEFLPILHDSSASDEKIRDTLVDVGEELRHILYHIHESRFYEYLGAGEGDD